MRKSASYLGIIGLHKSVAAIFLLTRLLESTDNSTKHVGITTISSSYIAVKALHTSHPKQDRNSEFLKSTLFSPQNLRITNAIYRRGCPKQIFYQRHSLPRPFWSAEKKASHKFGMEKISMTMQKQH